MLRTPAKLLLCFLPALTGCLMHTHKVQQAKLPPVLKEAGADQLVAAVNRKNSQLLWAVRSRAR
jgi:hypothetical protein